MKKILIILSFLVPFAVHGQDGFYTSGLLGINSTTRAATGGTNYYSYGEGANFTFDSKISFGFRFGVLFNDHFSAGIYLQRYTGKTFITTEAFRIRTSGQGHGFNAPLRSCPDPCENYEIVKLKHDYNVTFNNFMAELTYYVSEVDENGLWIGGLLGVTQIKNSPSDKDRHYLMDENSGAFGASLGYHFMVAPNFSISPQMSLIFIIGASDANFIQFSGLLNITLWL